MRLLHVVSCCVCLGFLWLTNAHTARYPHQWLQLNDSLPSAGQGGHTSSGAKQQTQQTLQPPGSYPFSRWVCLKEPWKMGERVTLQNEFKLLKQPTFFLWFLKMHPSVFVAGTCHRGQTKTAYLEGGGASVKALRIVRGMVGRAVGMDGGDAGAPAGCEVVCIELTWVWLVWWNLIKTRTSTKSAWKVGHERFQTFHQNFPRQLCFLLAIDITSSENYQGLLYSPPIFGGDQVGRHHTQAACQRVFLWSFHESMAQSERTTSISSSSSMAFTLGQDLKVAIFFGSPKKQLGKSPS